MKSPFTLDWENMKSPFTFDWENIVIVYIGLGKHKVIVYTGLTGIGKHEVIVYIGLGKHEVTVYTGLIGLGKHLHWTDRIVETGSHRLSSRGNLDFCVHDTYRQPCHRKIQVRDSEYYSSQTVSAVSAFHLGCLP